MNSNPHNPMTNAAQTVSGEETLRLIASLPAPAGLEERVHEALCAAPRVGKVVAWPAGSRSRISLKSNSMRTAAAAAIVFVVLGGGWGIYNRVEQVQNGRVVTIPARVPAAAGFAGAGAIRTPETLPGPKVREQETKGPREQESRPAKKLSGPTNVHGAQPTASGAAPQAVAR